MKRTVISAGASMVVLAATAMATGSNLAWNDCVMGGGVADRTVACTNSGSGFAYVSFNPEFSYPNVGATEVFINVAPASIGPWWNPTPTTARWGSAGIEPTSGACPAWWAGAAHGGITFQPPQAVLDGLHNRIRLRITTIIAAGEEQRMEPGTEYFMGSLQLKFNAGTFNNPECLAGAAIGVVEIVILQPGQVDSHLGQVADVSNCVTFRNPPSKQCPDGHVPTAKSTWGSIKAVYR